MPCWDITLIHESIDVLLSGLKHSISWGVFCFVGTNHSLQGFFLLLDFFSHNFLSFYSQLDSFRDCGYLKGVKGYPKSYNSSHSARFYPVLSHRVSTTRVALAFANGVDCCVNLASVVTEIAGDDFCQRAKENRITYFVKENCLVIQVIVGDRQKGSIFVNRDYGDNATEQVNKIIQLFKYSVYFLMVVLLFWGIFFLKEYSLFTLQCLGYQQGLLFSKQILFFIQALNTSKA